MVNDCNEHIVRCAVIKSEAAEETDDDQDGGFVSVDHQQVQATKVESNQGSLLIEATCAPAADIRHPTDLSLLNEAREVTEKLIDMMHPQVKESFGSKPRIYRQ